MERGQPRAAEVVAARKLAFLGLTHQIHDAGGDQLHGAGDQTRMRGRDGFPLVGVHADAEETRLGGDFLQRAVAGHAARAEDHVRTLVDRLLGRRRAPLGIDERLRNLARMVGRDDLDVRLDRLGARDVALVEGHHRRHQVRAQHRGDRAALGQARRQRTRQIARLILVEDQAGQVRQRLTLELVDTDEVDVGVRLGRRDRRIGHRKAHRHDHRVAGVDELLHVVGVVLGVLRLDVLDVAFRDAQRLRRLLHAFPGRLVEAAVVHPAHIRHHADLERCFGRLGFRGFGRFGRLGRFRRLGGFRRFGRLGRSRRYGSGLRRGCGLGATGGQDHAQYDEDA